MIDWVGYGMCLWGTLKGAKTRQSFHWGIATMGSALLILWGFLQGHWSVVAFNSFYMLTYVHLMYAFQKPKS